MKKRRWRVDPNTWILIKHILVGLAVLTAVGFLVAGIWYGTRLPVVTLEDEVEVSGGYTINHNLIRNIVSADLEGEYLGLIPKHFIWLYPKEKILSDLSKVNRIKDVTITRNKKRLSVKFDEYVPYALWCEAEDKEKCLFIDHTGYAFAPAPKLSGSSFLRFVTTGRKTKVGETVTDANKLKKTLELTESLKRQKWFVVLVDIDPVGDMFLSFSGGGQLKVDSKDEPKTVINNLLTILSAEKFSHLKPGNFQYIDLRFGNKVFVNEKPDDLETKTASGTRE